MNIERDDAPRPITGTALEELRRTVTSQYELNHQIPPSKKEVDQQLRDRGYIIEE